MSAGTAPNAFYDYQRAAVALVDQGAINRAFDRPTRYGRNPFGPSRLTAVRGAGKASVTPKTIAALVARNARALRWLRTALEHPYRNPDATVPRFPYSRHRSLAKIALLRGDTLQGRGDLRGALSAYLDVVEMGIQTGRGETVIGALVARAVERIGVSRVEPLVGRLPRVLLLAAVRRLERIDERRGSAAEVLVAEGRFATNQVCGDLARFDAGGRAIRPSVSPLDEDEDGEGGASDLLLGFLIATIGKDRMVRAHEATVRDRVGQTLRPFALRDRAAFGKGASGVARALLTDPYGFQTSDLVESVWCSLEASRAALRLFTVRLALRAYYLDHKSYPEGLPALVPTYLRAAPHDPFAERTPLLYRRAGAKYVLYSVGPDGRDDGGRPLCGTESTDTSSSQRVQVESLGDQVDGVTQP
jgi:hypothetical protein